MRAIEKRAKGEVGERAEQRGKSFEEIQASAICDAHRRQDGGATGGDEKRTSPCDEQTGGEDKKYVSFRFRADGPGWVIPTQAGVPLLQQERLKRQRAARKRYAGQGHFRYGDERQHGQRRKSECGIDAGEPRQRERRPVRAPVRRQRAAIDMRHHEAAQEKK